MMQYALFARPVVTIYDLPQTTKQSEAGLVSTIGDEGLYGQACDWFDYDPNQSVRRYHPMGNPVLHYLHDL